jgi:hypothetical protein|tara:strand:+ start:597 stop:818 length:222 start_codon:yes stop_codon:yes gene_type:complete
MSTKPIKRKCHSCGKMATNPYTYTIVPTYTYGQEIPLYTKSGVKTNRVDLKGERKVLIHNYCNKECYNESRSI